MSAQAENLFIFVQLVPVLSMAAIRAKIIHIAFFSRLDPQEAEGILETFVSVPETHLSRDEESLSTSGAAPDDWAIK